MPTPAQEAEVESLMSARSPIPSLDIRRPANFTADNAIPGLDINPPARESAGKSKGSQQSNGKTEGGGGWFSRLTQTVRDAGQAGDGKRGGAYDRLENADDE